MLVIRITLLSAWLLLSSGCAVNFDLFGGPRHELIWLPTDEVETRLREHLGESPSAMALLETVSARRRLGTTFAWAGGGLFVPCSCSWVLWGIPLAPGPERTLILGAINVAVCGASIALALAAIIVTPKLSTWGTVLGAYDDEFPATPWSSRILGVPPGAPLPVRRVRP